MPIIQAFGNAAARAYGLMASGLKRISDAFNRSDNGSSLGTTDTGQVWENVRGTWGISSNQASTSTSASTYPMAAVQYGGVNATIIADVTPGSGVAFWINDSQNWWGTAGVTVQNTGYSTYPIVGANSTCSGGTTSTTCQQCLTCFSYTALCTANAYGCTSYSLQFLGGAFYNSCSGYGITGCASYGAACTNFGYASCNCTTSFTCTATTITGYYIAGYGISSYNFNTFRMDLLKSIANTITTVATQSISSAAASIKTILSSTGINIKTYSGSQASGSELGTITDNATGANKATKHGIILTSSSSQGTTIDNFSVDIVQ